MENIILSLLLLNNMTIYEMRTYIQKNLSTVCSDSLGSMQSSIKKLLEKGFIEVTEILDNNMLKKEYSITKAGLDFYKDWTGTPLNIQKFKNMEEGKFFFLGMASKEKRIRFLQQHIYALDSEMEKLNKIKALVDSTKKDAISVNINRFKKEKTISKNLLKVSEETDIETVVKNIYTYQIYMLEYGLERIKSDLDFYKKILRKEM